MTCLVVSGMLTAALVSSSSLQWVEQIRSRPQFFKAFIPSITCRANPLCLVCKGAQHVQLNASATCPNHLGLCAPGTFYNLRKVEKALLQFEFPITACQSW